MEPTRAPSNKRSWPLLVLGACAFVPGLGLGFAAAAVTWGLVSDRPRVKWGVMLGAAGALLNLGGGAFPVPRCEQAPVFELPRSELPRPALGRWCSRWSATATEPA